MIGLQGSLTLVTGIDTAGSRVLLRPSLTCNTLLRDMYRMVWNSIDQSVLSKSVSNITKVADQFLGIDPTDLAASLTGLPLTQGASTCICSLQGINVLLNMEFLNIPGRHGKLGSL